MIEMVDESTQINYIEQIDYNKCEIIRLLISLNNSLKSILFK